MSRCYICGEKVNVAGITQYIFECGVRGKGNNPDKQFAFRGLVEDLNGNEICLCKNCFVNALGNTLVELHQSVGVKNGKTLQ